VLLASLCNTESSKRKHNENAYGKRRERFHGEFPWTRKSWCLQSCRCAIVLNPARTITVATLLQKELFRVCRIVEQDRQLDAAVTVLGEVGFSAIARVEIRRGIVRRKQHQRVEERLQRDLFSNP